jgi:hypothetical protein
MNVPPMAPCLSSFSARPALSDECLSYFSTTIITFIARSRLASMYSYAFL